MIQFLSYPHYTKKSAKVFDIMVIAVLETCVDVSKNCKGNANLRNCVFGVNPDVQRDCKKSCGQCGKF